MPAGTSTASSGWPTSTARCADGDRARDDVAGFLGARTATNRGDARPHRTSGDADEVAARLQDYVDAGVRHFVISPAADTDTLEVVTLAANEVLPQLSSRRRSLTAPSTSAPPPPA